LPVGIRETENGNWIAFNPSLKVIGYSSVSEEDALRDLNDSVSLFFDIHLKDETLDEALISFGWESKIDSQAQNVFQTTQRFTSGLTAQNIDIPLQFA